MRNWIGALLILVWMAACSGSGTPAPAPTQNPDAAVSATGVSGTWSIVSNECEDDETALVITQSGSDLSFSGSFDYQAGPDSFSGTFSDDTLTFTIEGADSTADCSATLAGDTFFGSCEVSGAQAETCGFEYRR